MMVTLNEMHFRAEFYHEQFTGGEFLATDEGGNVHSVRVDLRAGWSGQDHLFDRTLSDVAAMLDRSPVRGKSGEAIEKWLAGKIKWTNGRPEVTYLGRARAETRLSAIHAAEQEARSCRGTIASATEIIARVEASESMGVGPVVCYPTGRYYANRSAECALVRGNRINWQRAEREFFEKSPYSPIRAGDQIVDSSSVQSYSFAAIDASGSAWDEFTSANSAETARIEEIRIRREGSLREQRDRLTAAESRLASLEQRIAELEAM